MTTTPENKNAAAGLRRRRPGFGLLGTLVLAILMWAAWPLLPPLAQAPFHALRLAWQDSPSYLPVPVAGVRPAVLHDTWGAARSGGRRHEGIDIFAPKGRPVLSATEGLVTQVGTSRLGGKVVWVMGPGRQMHYYAHLDDYGPISPGDLVRAGAQLGTVGNTGNARGTPPHLHYGIYEAGGALNPYPLLTASPEAAMQADAGKVQ